MTNLRGLKLSGRLITGKGISHIAGLKQLEWLNLDATGVGDEDLVHLEGLTNLKQIRVSHTNVTQQGVERLRQRLPDCSILWR
jgi:hypothetical protein